MKIITNYFRGLALLSRCRVTGKQQVHYMECSRAHLEQNIKAGEANGCTGSDVAMTAQLRWEKAQKLRKQRYNRRLREAEELQGNLYLTIPNPEL